MALKIQRLLLPIYKAFRYQSYNFIWDPKSNKQSGFTSYGESKFLRKIEDYMKRPVVHKVYEEIEDSIKTQLTERYRSFSKIKVLLVITEIPLDEEELRPFQTSPYGEKINLYNFVLDSSLVEKFEGPLSTKLRVGRLIYGTENHEVDEFIQIMENEIYHMCE